MVHTLRLVKAVDSFQSFSNTIGHRSINELCLASLQLNIKYSGKLGFCFRLKVLKLTYSAINASRI